MEPEFISVFGRPKVTKQEAAAAIVGLILLQHIRTSLQNRVSALFKRHCSQLYWANLMSQERENSLLHFEQLFACKTHTDRNDLSFCGLVLHLF